MANDLAPKDEEFEVMRKQLYCSIVQALVVAGKSVTYPELFDKATRSAQEYFKMRGLEASNE